MKTLINVYTARKLGGKNYTQVVIDENVAVEIITELISHNAIKVMTHNDIEDRSGRNYGGYIMVAMLKEAGGEIIEKGISED